MKSSLVVITLLLIAPLAAQGGFGQGGRGGGAPAGDPAAAPTPRLANGKPDLTGSWGGGGWSFTGAGAPGATVGGMFRRCTPFQSKQCMEWTNQSEDWPFMSTARLDMRGPIYKPEHWDKMIEMDQWTNRDDPVMTCLPLGIPRQGPPARIFATDTDITFLYRAGVDGAGGYAEHRMVAIDGKPHDPRRAANYTYMGYTVGRWEGDTLVVETTNFNGKNAFQGSSENLKVTERFTRTADDTLSYRFTVEDPQTWDRPWTAEAPLAKTEGPIFEFACHETNYGIANILAGARADEKKAAEQKKGSN